MFVREGVDSQVIYKVKFIYNLNMHKSPSNHSYAQNVESFLAFTFPKTRQILTYLSISISNLIL